MMRNATTCLLLLCVFSVNDDPWDDDGFGCDEGDGVSCSGGGCSCEWVEERNEDCALDCHELNAECVSAPSCGEACAEACAERRTRCLRGCVEEHLDCRYDKGTCENHDND